MKIKGKIGGVEVELKCTECLRINSCMKSIGEVTDAGGIDKCFIRRPPAPKDKGEVHTSCEGCEWEKVQEHNCAGCIQYNNERKNYTPAPQPTPIPPLYDKVHGIDCLFSESKDCSDCEANPHISALHPAPHKTSCARCGAGFCMTRDEDAQCLDFVPKQPAPTPSEPVFTIPEIIKWHNENWSIEDFATEIKDTQFGIAAVANRKDGGK